jgi:hypothetical protein
MNTGKQMIEFNVRGKRKRREPAPVAERAITKPRLRGRPMKTAEELKARKKVRTAPTPSTAHTLKSTSWLERLPVELIEQIFLHALEINMAEASPFLGRTLAKESIYKMLILFAFFDDDEKHPVETKHFAPATYRLLSLEEKVRLQQGVLDSPWCTLNRIRRQLPILNRLVAVQEWHCDRARDIENAKVLTPKQQNGDQSTPPSPSRTRFAPLPPFADTDALDEHYDSMDYTAMFIRPETRVAAQHNIRGTFNARYFPPRLLNPPSWHITGPRDNTAADRKGKDDLPFELLTLLHEGHRTIEDLPDWNASSSPIRRATADFTALGRGIETAIHERHAGALGLLMQICDKISDSCNDGHRQRSSEWIMPLLHLATKQGRDSRWIVEMMMDRWEAFIQKDDRVLTKWALVEAEAGSLFASWLLDFMERIET